MIISSPNDIAFTLFGYEIYWYGIIMAFSMLISILIADKLYSFLHGKKDIILMAAPLIIFSGIIGARLYFCLLNPGYYFSHPLEFLDIRAGGMSIHGAIIGGILSLIWAAKKYKEPILQIIDSCACSVAIGQAIGRWGNFFNSEAFGLPVVGQNWGLFIPIEKRPAMFMNFELFQPAFLYESIADIFAFIILLFVFLKLGKKYKGLTFYLYLILYSLIRFFIEQIRLDSAFNVGGIHIATIVSGIMFMIGVTGLIYILLKMKSPQNDTTVQ